MDDDSEDEDQVYWVVQHHGKNVMEGQEFDTYEAALAVFQRLPWGTACCLLDAWGSEVKYWGRRGECQRAMLDWWEEQRKEDQDELTRMSEESRRCFNSMFCVVTKVKSNGQVYGAFFEQASLAKASYKELPWQPAVVLGPGGEELGRYGSTTDVQEMVNWWQEMSTTPKEDAPHELYYEPVVLNVYDVGSDATTRRVNTVLRPLGSGAYHGAVQIFGREYSYGGSDECDNDGRKTGVYACAPRANFHHRFRESLYMGRTKLSRQKVRKLLKMLEEEWPADKYNVLLVNCCHFCDTFCEALGVGPSPKWLLAAAERGRDILEAVSEGMNVRGADEDDSYKFGDFTRGAVHKLVHKNRSSVSDAISSHSERHFEGTTCCAFFDYMKNVLHKKWLPM